MNLQKIIRPIVLIALFAIPVFPLIVANSYFFPFITGKAFYFRIIVEIAFAGWIILAFLNSKYRPRLNPITIAVSLFALITLVADLLGVNPLRSLWSNFERMEGWITIIHLWAFYIAATGIFGADEEGRRWWHRWFNMSLIVAFLVACYGFWQLVGKAAIHQGSSRIDASLGNSAYMAVYMLMSTGMAAYMFFVAHAKKIANASTLVWIYPILAVIFAFELVETATRGTTLGLGIGAIVAMILYGVLADGVTKKKLWILGSYALLGIISLLLSFKVTIFGFAPAGTIYSAIVLTGFVSLVYFIVYIVFMSRASKHAAKHVTVARYWIAGLFALILLAAISFISLRNAPFVQHNEILSRIASISLNDSSGQARQYIWPMALKGAVERPLFGWGQENFNYIFNADYNPHMYNQEQWFDRAHSVFLDWLTASGFVGLIAYLALYIVFLMAVWKSSLTVAEKSVLTGLLAGYAIHNIFVFDNLASYVLFFSILGFASALHEAHVPAWLGGTKHVRADAVEYIVAPLVIVALVAVFYVFDVRAIQANTRLIAALQACSSTPDAASAAFERALGVDVYVANQEIREQIYSCTGNVIQASRQAPQYATAAQNLYNLSLKTTQDQVKAAPKDARIYTLAGSYLNSIGQTSQAASFLEKAHALSPNKQATDFELATSYINTGNKAGALALLKQAYEEDTTYDQARSAYATALVIAGQEAQAKALFGNDAAIFNTERMAAAYVSVQKYSQAIAILQSLMAANPNNAQYASELAQIQYSAGQISQAIATLRALETAHPEYKDSIEGAIKQIQQGK